MTFLPIVERELRVAARRTHSYRTRTLAAFIACVFLDAPWPITIVLCIFSVTNDMGIPALWAYNLDVGKRNVGLVLGWGNMWGNLGASAGALLFPWLKAHGGGDGKYFVFFTLATAMLLAGLVVLPMNATKKLLPDDR